MFSVRLLIITALGISAYSFCMENGYKEKSFIYLKSLNNKDVDDHQIVTKKCVALSDFENLKEVHIHNVAIEEISMDSELSELRSFSLTNSKIKKFELEKFLTLVPKLESLDLSRNNQLNELFISKYKHTMLGYIGLNNSALYEEQINKFKELIQDSSVSKRPLIAAQTYTFTMPSVTHSSPELAACYE